MALQSQLFRGDLKLEAAAVSDPAHILAGARGPHVAKIQQALIQVDGAAITQDSSYGPATAAAVDAFKQKRQILNFQGKIDNIVGKKTIAALDAEMIAKEKGGGGSRGRLGFSIAGDITPPGRIPTGNVIVDPFLFSATNPMILTAIFDDPNKSDLNADNPPRPRLTPRELNAVNSIGGLGTSALELLMRAELFVTAQGLGIEMFDRFKRNTVAGASITFDSKSNLGNEVITESDFVIAVHDKVRLEFDALIKAQFAKGRVNVNALQAKTSGRMVDSDTRLTLTNPAGVKTSPIVGTNSTLALLAVIGGRFQGGVVAVTAFSANTTLLSYEAKLVYTLTDHFGVDNSDVVFDGFHGTNGQKAFWLLQHQPPPGHKPFVTTVVIELSVAGRLF